VFRNFRRHVEVTRGAELTPLFRGWPNDSTAACVPYEVQNSAGHHVSNLTFLLP